MTVANFRLQDAMRIFEAAKSIPKSNWHKFTFML
jgi:hypothetical protein